MSVAKKIAFWMLACVMCALLLGNGLTLFGNPLLLVGLMLFGSPGGIAIAVLVNDWRAGKGDRDMGKAMVISLLLALVAIVVFLGGGAAVALLTAGTS